MSKIIATLGHSGDFDNGLPYLSDAGVLFNINSQLQLPLDAGTQDTANAIATAIDAQLLKFRGEIITPYNAICSDKENFKPRKLQFIRSNGSTISVVIPFRDKIVITATAIKQAIEAAGNFSVVCIKLVGESFKQLNDFLGVNDKAEIGESVPAIPPNGGQGSNYAEFHEYNSDARFGSKLITPYKIRSDNNDALPTFLPVTIATKCLGDPINVLGCAGQTSRKHRRYILDLITTEQKGERREIPVSLHEIDDIASCGRDLAAIPGVYCIGYKGESNARIHTLL